MKNQIKKIYILIFSLAFLFNCCVNNSKNIYNKSLTIEKIPFGKTSDGILVNQFIMKNINGMKVGIITFGGIITFINMLKIKTMCMKI